MASSRALSAFVGLSLFAMLSAAAAAPDAAAQAAAAPASPLSDAQFQKIDDMLRRWHGKPVEVLAKVAQALDLGGNGDVFTLGRVATTDRSGIRSQISLLNNGKGYLITRHSGKSTRIFMMDLHRALVSGVTIESDGFPETIPAEDAQRMFTQDLAVWAAFADSLPAPKAR